jgi:hypothetical protein
LSSSSRDAGLCTPLRFSRDSPRTHRCTSISMCVNIVRP